MEGESDRVPPSDVRAEKRILASVLEDETMYDEVSDILRSQHFYSDANRTVFSAFEAIREDGDDISMPSVLEWLQDNKKLARIGGMAYLDTEIYRETPAVLDPSRDAERVVDRWIARQTIASSKGLCAKAYISSPGDLQPLVSEHIEQLATLLDNTNQQSEVSLKEAVKEYSRDLQDRLYKIQQLEEKGLPLVEISTGLTDLDDVLGGGLHRGDLIVVAGRPGMGKSSVGYKLAEASAGKLNYDGVPMATAYCSLEMPKSQLVMRAACMEGRVPLTQARTLKFTAENMRRYYAALHEISDRPVYIFDNVSDLDGILARLRKIKLRARKEGMELGTVVLDYLQLIESAQGRSQTRENVVAQISRRCKLAAKVLDVPLVVLAQLNRDCENQGNNKRPKLNHLRESGAVEQDADVVVFLYREDYYKEKEARDAANDDTDGAPKYEPTNILELDVAKQRNGPASVVKAYWNGMCTRIDNLEKGEPF